MGIPALSVTQLCQLPYRRFATGRTLKHPVRSDHPKRRRLKTCDTAACKAALRWPVALRCWFAFPCAAPTPFFGRATQACFDRIIPNVADDTRLLLVVAYPMVIRFALPKIQAGSSQKFICFTRGEPFPTVKNISEQMIGHRPDDGMNVIGHDNPRAQFITFPVEMAQRRRDNIRNFRSPQSALTHALVQITLQIALIIPIDEFQCICGFSRLFQRAQPLRSPSLKGEQNFFGQTVG